MSQCRSLAHNSRIAHQQQQQKRHIFAWIAPPGRHVTSCFTSGSKRMYRARRIPSVETRTTSQSTILLETEAPSSVEEKSLEHSSHRSIQRWKSVPKNELLMYWKGEAREGYSLEFRHLEFKSALEAVIGEKTALSSSSLTSSLPPFEFTNALVYAGSRESMNDYHVEGFNQAIQYLRFKKDSSITLWQYRQAVERCALIRAIYEVVATANSVEDLAELALASSAFDDLQPPNSPTDVEKERGTPVSWCVRVKHFHDVSSMEENSLSNSTLSLDSGSSSSSSRAGGPRKERRYSTRKTGSFTSERPVITALKPLLLSFDGKVDLENPDCKIYMFDGLEPNRCKMLAREIAVGPKISLIAPNSRICVTTTPLCPVAAYLLCNVAKIRDQDTVLDPFAGSCTTLMAAAMIAPRCRTVGIEIAHNGEVNRDDIQLDFSTRNFKPPLALIHGDCTDASIRDLARTTIGNSPFDVIVTDPPYGIREKMNDGANGSTATPLEALFAAMAADRRVGKPLLKRGGRLVAYCPCRANETLTEILPTAEQAADAGLVLTETREQRIRDNLSRWLVAYTTIERGRLEDYLWRRN